MQTFKQFITEAGTLQDYDWVARQHGFSKVDSNHVPGSDPVTGAGGFYGGNRTIHHYEHPSGKKFSIHDHNGQRSFFYGDSRDINQKYGKTPNGLDKHLKSLKEGVEEHEKLKDHKTNPYHKLLTQHGFVHQSTTHKQNPFAKNNPRYDTTEHFYTHPKHGKSSVKVEMEHDSTIGHGGQKNKGHSYLLRHEQDNGIMAPNRGNSKNQLHQDLSYNYGVPKGMEPPKLTASQRKYPHTAPKYKMNEARFYDQRTELYNHPARTNHNSSQFSHYLKGLEKLHDDLSVPIEKLSKKYKKSNKIHPESGKPYSRHLEFLKNGHGLARTYLNNAHNEGHYDSIAADHALNTMHQLSDHLAQHFKIVENKNED
jgi:hypothetical protein